jgi:photosystem II stability/assembly factor-like uncharacterized protein
MISLVTTRRPWVLACAVALMTTPFTTDPARAQIDPSRYQGMQWRNIGPFIAGKVDAVAGVTGQPAMGYAATDNGGIWKTVNAGTTWVPVTDGVEAVRGFTALAVAQSQPSVVYAGTGSVFGSHYGSGIWKSGDAGAHWESAGLRDAGAISWLMVDPHDPNQVLAATRGVDHQKGGARGVFRSSDGGKTWSLVLDAAPESGATYLSSAIDEPKVIYATVAPTYVPPGLTDRSLDKQHAWTSLYKSTDGGLTWTKLQGLNQPEQIGETAVAAGSYKRKINGEAK